MKCLTNIKEMLGVPEENKKIIKTPSLIGS